MSNFKRISVYRPVKPVHDLKDCMIKNIVYLYYSQSYKDVFDGKPREIAGLDIEFGANARDFRDATLTKSTTAFDYEDFQNGNSYDFIIDLFNESEYVNNQNLKFLHTLADAVHAQGTYNVDANGPSDLVSAYAHRIWAASLNLFDVKVTHKTSKQDHEYLKYDVSAVGDSNLHYTTTLFKRHPNFGLSVTRLGNQIVDKVPFTEDEKKYISEIRNAD